MIHLFTLIKSDLKISSPPVLEVLNEIILEDHQLAQQDICFALLTSFPFTSTRRFENTEKPIIIAEATAGQHVAWERAKFFKDFLDATELHRWDYNSIGQWRLIEGVPAYITLVGTASYCPNKYDDTIQMEAEQFHRFCDRYHSEGDIRFATIVHEPVTQVYVVPEPDPFPPKPPVTYQEALEATHAPLPIEPQPLALPEPTHWVDRLIAYFKGKGKKNA